jgi:hypothetical protein
MIKIWVDTACHYREVESLVRVTLPGYEEYQFHATDAIEPWNRGMINITEARTGEIVGSGIDIKQATSSALMQLQKYTKNEINERIENVLTRHKEEMAENALSPAYIPESVGRLPSDER